MATSRKDPSTLGGSTTMRTKQHTNAVCVMGQMVEFSPGTSSEEMACNAMVEASIEESPIYFRGAAEQDFLGWEYHMAKNVVGNLPQWYKSMSDYSTISGDDFGTLSTEDRDTTLQVAVAHGKTYGNLTSDGEPIPIR